MINITVRATSLESIELKQIRHVPTHDHYHVNAAIHHTEGRRRQVIRNNPPPLGRRPVPFSFLFRGGGTQLHLDIAKVE